MRAFALVMLAGIGTAAATGCAPRSAYVAPVVITPPAFREDANWKPVRAEAASLPGDWWTVFGDPGLNALEARVAVSNQTLKAAQAQFAQARALVRNTRSSLFPHVDSGASLTSARQSGNRPGSGAHDPYGDAVLAVDASYEADVWGRVRSAVESARTTAQASAADVEAVGLSLHAELANDYFALHGLDRLQQLLDAAVDAYQRALELTQNRFRGGLSSQADVAQAETQLETTRAQAVDNGVDRAALEHAIAALTGEAASSFTLPAAPLTLVPPVVPVGLPSDLLERRPDIAATERRVASATAEVSVATATFYPLLTLSGSTGFESSSFGAWLASASNFWTTGIAAAVSLFDAGRRRAVQDQAVAVLSEASANYRQSVLVAFREVEDQLAALRILENEEGIQDAAVAAADRSLNQATNRYRGGVTGYLEVVTAQNALLTNQRVAVGIRIRRMNASVLLVKALGGGWTTASLPVLAAGR